MIFPIGDTNVVGGYKPYFCHVFIAINVIVFLIQLAVPGELICEFATIPGNIRQGTGYFTIITSMFMHGGFIHLIGNMLFLYIFADNIEAVIGSGRFVVFYILGGVAASLLHVGIDTWSVDPTVAINCCKWCTEELSCTEGVVTCAGFVPSLGASGATAAVLGAYIVLFPKSRIKIFALITTFTIPAIAFLGFWFVQQLFAGVGSLGAALGGQGGVAWWAHIGGFVFGLGFGWLNRSSVHKMLDQNSIHV